MRIKKLQIRNFKSLVDFELENLKPFCAFVGPNASGKSNIFEALEFTNYTIRYGSEAVNFFGGLDNILSYQMLKYGQFSLDLDYEFIDNILIGFSLEINEGSYRLLSSANGIKNTELTSLDIRDITTRILQNGCVSLSLNLKILKSRDQISTGPTSSLFLKRDQKYLSPKI